MRKNLLQQDVVCVLCVHQEGHLVLCSQDKTWGRPSKKASPGKRTLEKPATSGSSTDAYRSHTQELSKPEATEVAKRAVPRPSTRAPKVASSEAVPRPSRARALCKEPFVEPSRAPSHRSRQPHHESTSTRAPSKAVVKQHDETVSPKAPRKAVSKPPPNLSSPEAPSKAVSKVRSPKAPSKAVSLVRSPKAPSEAVSEVRFPKRPSKAVKAPSKAVPCDVETSDDEAGAPTASSSKTPDRPSRELAPPATEEAKEQRLRRLCEKKPSGKIHVPQHIHEKWAKGGSNRQELMELLEQCEFKRDRVGSQTL